MGKFVWPFAGYSIRAAIKRLCLILGHTGTFLFLNFARCTWKGEISVSLRRSVAQRGPKCFQVGRLFVTWPQSSSRGFGRGGRIGESEKKGRRLVRYWRSGYPARPIACCKRSVSQLGIKTPPPAMGDC